MPIVKSLKTCQPAIAEKWALNAGNGGPTRWYHLSLTPFTPKRTEMALPVPTKSLLETSPNAAMLFWCTHPPPPIMPFLLKQNLFPKDIARSDIMKKVSWRKRLSVTNSSSENNLANVSTECSSHHLPYVDCWFIVDCLSMVNHNAYELFCSTMIVSILSDVSHLFHA